MLDLKPVDKILFLDIETTSQYPTYENMPERIQNLFVKRFIKDAEGQVMAELSDEGKAEYLEVLYTKKAPLSAEWNKIICISVGYLVKRTYVVSDNVSHYDMKVKTVYSRDEKELLLSFVMLFGKYLNHTSLFGKYAENNFVKDDTAYAICAHNGKAFDFPVIAKRLIINGIDLPRMFDYSLIKPWDLFYFIDTKESWKFNTYDGHVSLDILSSLFNVESPKDRIDGTQVKDVYYTNMLNGKEVNGLEEIVKYCEKDILALARIYLKMKCMKEPVNYS